MDIVAWGNLCPQALDDSPYYTNAVQDVIGSVSGLAFIEKTDIQVIIQ